VNVVTVFIPFSIFRPVLGGTYGLVKKMCNFVVLAMQSAEMSELAERSANYAGLACIPGWTKAIKR